MALIAIGVGPSTAGALQQATPASLVFDSVTVVDVEQGRLLPDQRVVIQGNRIHAIGPASRIRSPRDAQLVRAEGKYLIPGLWDMHVHPMEYVDIAYPLFVAHGVTGIRDAGSSASLATLTQWKRDIAAGRRVGPRVLVSGPSLNEAPAGWLGQVPHFLYVPPSAAASVVDSLAAAGADFIKTYHMSQEMYFAVAAAARRAGIPFGGHLPDSVDGRIASDSGAMFLDHDALFLPEVCKLQYPSGAMGDTLPVDRQSCAAVGRALRRNHTWVTMMGWRGAIDSLAGQPRAAVYAYLLAQRLRYLPDSFPDRPAPVAEGYRPPASFADFWANPMSEVLGQTAQLHEADIPMVIGTDAVIGPRFTPLFAGPGFSMHEALVGLVLGGLTPLDALRTATLNPAQALYATDSLGTVAMGKLADVVLLDANPLDDIWNTTKIRGVVANGRYYDRPALDKLLSDAARSARETRRP